MTEQAIEKDSRSADASATACLVELLEQFNEDAARSARGMREMLEQDCSQFLRAAQPLLRSIPDSRGLRALVTLLWSKGLFLNVLCNPSTLRLDEAVQLARAALSFNPVLEKVLMRCLLGANEPGALDDVFQERLLEIMAALSDGDRLLPPAMLQHPNVRIRSKAALLIGRSQNNSRWLKKRMSEADPRVRANAIEAVWGTTDVECKGILWDAASDEHHRVAANALVALYGLGETGSIALMIDMSGRASPLSRSAGAWAMGHTRDRRFLPVLAGMFSEADGTLRKTVFSAISKIKQGAASLLDAGRLCVSISKPSSQAEGLWRMGATVTTQEGLVVPGIRPTHFVVSSGGEPVAHFNVHENRLDPALLIGFLIPAAGAGSTAYRDYVERCLVECKKYQRPGDLWCVWEYSMTRPGVAASSEPAGAGKAGGVPEAAFGFLASAAPVETHRHLILIGPERPLERAAASAAAGEWNRLAAAARAAGATIHVLSGGPDGADFLNDLCSQERGRLYRADSRVEMRSHLEALCRSLLETYEITYRIPESGGAQPATRLQIYSPQGCGEDSSENKADAPKELTPAAD